MSESTLEALGGGAAPPAQFGHDALVVCDNLVRIFQSGSVEVQALQGLDLLVDEGEMVAVVGASGSGKSTLLAVLSGMDAPTAGRVRVGRWDLMAMPARDRVAYRRADGRLRVAADLAQPAAVPDRPAERRAAHDATPPSAPGRAGGRAARPRRRRAGRRPAAAGDVRRRAAARRDRDGARQRPAAAAGRRADRRARHRHGAGGVRRAAHREPGVRHHGRRRHARPGRQRAGGAHGRDPGRAHQQRGRCAGTPAATSPTRSTR